MQPPEPIEEHYYILEQPVNFRLSVNKRLLDAQFISASFEAGLGYLLKIKFSDGHEGDYRLDDYGVYPAHGKLDQYCKALQKEIHNTLACWTSEKKVYVLNYPINGTDANIWITGYEKDYFSVYYFNEFRFQVKKEQGKWNTRIPDAYEDKPIDKDLLNSVIKALNYYTS